MKFTINISKKQIDAAYAKALKDSAKNVTIKGFRKGKAPLNLVEEKLGKSKIQNQALEELIPAEYTKAITQKKLEPISYPEITPKTVEKIGDWVFEVEVPLKPEIKLGKYIDKLKGSLAKSKIWKPGDDPDPKTQPDQASAKDSKLKIIFDTLLETCQLDVPEILIKREAQRMLSKLVNQLQQLGVTLEDYTKSIGKTAQELTQEYHQTATDNLKLEFILQEIAIDQKINVNDTEIDQLIANVPDDKTKENLQSDSARLNLKLVLLKRKTIEKLEALAA